MSAVLNKSPIDETIEKGRNETGNAPNKEISNQVDRYLASIKNFESDTVKIAKDRAKIYKNVSIASLLIATLAVGAVIAIAPFVKVIPYVIKVNGTNHVEVLQPLSDAKKTTYGEVLDKHWLNQFVVSRNSYEWETVQTDYNRVKLMSNNKVFGAYANYIQGDDSPTEIFGENNVIKIKILDTVILPSTTNEQIIAQVRFIRTIENGVGQLSTGYEATTWNSTLTFDYLADIKTEDERRLNPLNFRVTSYREDRILNND